MKKVYKFLAVLMALVFTSLGVSPVYASNISGNKTEISQTVVFINEQPIPSFQVKGKQYISLKRLSDYGFDLSTKGALTTIKLNPKKEIKFLDKKLVNLKKNDASFRKIYDTSVSKNKVAIMGKTYSTLEIDNQICISVDILLQYATLEKKDSGQVIKLDTKKREFMNAEAKTHSKTINYPDARSAGYEFEYGSEFISAAYSGGMKDGKRQGFGSLSRDFSYAPSDQKSHVVYTGYWKNNVCSGYQIVEGSKLTSGNGVSSGGNIDFLEEYSLLRANCVDGVANDGQYLYVYISYAPWNKADSHRDEGYWLNSNLTGTRRVSRFDDTYRYGYQVTYEGEFISGESQMSAAEIKARYEKKFPPYTTRYWVEIEKKAKDYINEGKTYIPGNITECTSELKSFISREERERIKNYEDTSECFQKINTLVLDVWLGSESTKLSGYFNKMGVYDSSDMFSIILNAFIADIRGGGFDLEAEVRYVKYQWAMIDAYGNIGLVVMF